MRNISVWTQYIHGPTPEEVIGLFSAHGWYHLELSHEHGIELLKRRGDPAETGRKFRAMAADHNVVLPQGHLLLTCDITADDKGATLDQLRRWLDLFLGIGIHAAVLHPGGRAMANTGASAEAVFDARIVALQTLTRHVEGTDLVIALENIPEPYAHDEEDLIPLVDALDRRNIGICLDTGHLNIVGGNPEKFIRAAGSRLVALHIADNEGKTDQHLMPYGRGTVDWKAFMRGIRAINYEGLFNLEIPGESLCPVPVLFMKLDYLRRAIAYMMAEDAG